MRRGTQLRKTLVAKFDDELRFFRGWMNRPKSVGSIVPTSSVTARRMASVIDTGSGLPVLEVGPGTGVITRAILRRGVKPENLYAIEYSPDFVRHLRRAFPGVHILEADAFDMDGSVREPMPATFDCAISGMPLLNFPIWKRVAYVESLLSRLPAGRPLVQFTYGPRSPVPAGLGGYTVEHFDFVIRNIPPARLWVYRRPLHN